MYGFGSEASGTDMIKLNPLNTSLAEIGPNKLSPLYLRINGLISSEGIATIFFILVSLVGRSGVSIVGVIVLIFLIHRVSDVKFIVLLLGIYLAGLGAIVIIENHTQEQWAFFWYGDIALAALAGIGLTKFFSTHKHWSCQKFLMVSFLAIVGSVQVFDYARSFQLDSVTIGVAQGEPSFHGESALVEIIAVLKKYVKKKAVVYTVSKNLLGTSNEDERIIASSLANVSLLANDYMLETLNRNNRNYSLKNWADGIRMVSNSTTKAVSATRFIDGNMELYLITSVLEPIHHGCMNVIHEGLKVLIYKYDSENCRFNSDTENVIQRSKIF